MRRREKVVTTAPNIMRKAGGGVTRVEAEAGVEAGAEAGEVEAGVGVGAGAGVEGAEEEGAEAGAEVVAGGGAAGEAGVEVGGGGGVVDMILNAETQIATMIKTFAFMLGILRGRGLCWKLKFEL